MKVKELAFSAQQRLKEGTGIAFGRSHIYELLAASFGFNSYAAFGVDSVFTQRYPNDGRFAPPGVLLRQRCVELGYATESAELISATLGVFLIDRRIGVVRISALIRRLAGECSGMDNRQHGDDGESADDTQDERPDSVWTASDDEEFPPIMLDGLESAAAKGNPLAHYALALIHAPDDDDTDQETGSAYWYSQALQGQLLTGVEKEWADAHAAWLAQADKHTRHLREAGRLGHTQALLELAERFDDPSFFERPRREVAVNPLAIAEIAGRMGRTADVKHWLTEAAESGDTDAMLDLIEDHDRDDQVRCWTWVYLARMLGTDFTRDAHNAVHEDGSTYDDDLGGTAFVAGPDGIDLDPLGEVQDAIAKETANRLFQQIRQADAASRDGWDGLSETSKGPDNL